MKSTMITCDICGEVIGEHPIDGYHGKMIQHGDPYQAWPTEDGPIRDICPRCCSVLAQAKRLGLIEFDLEPLLMGGGFKQQSATEWQRGGMFQERFVMKGENDDD